MISVFLALLSGHAKVDIHDEAFGQVNLGFMGQNLDILRARLCFRGHAEYNLNLFQVCPASLKQRLTLYIYCTLLNVVHGMFTWFFHWFALLILLNCNKYLCLLQEFDVGEIKRLVDLFDKLKKQTVDAVVNGIKLFRNLLEGDISFEKILKSFVDTLTNLPDKVWITFCYWIFYL